MTKAAIVGAIALVALGCGSSDSGGSGTGGSSATGGTAAGGTSSGGTSSGGTSAGGTGGTSSGGAAGLGSGGSAGASGDGGDCYALLAEMQAKLAEAASCYAGTPNPSSCEIIKDGVCNCAAVQLGHEQPYLAAAKAFLAAGCKTICPGVVCKPTAVCTPNSAGSTQGTCTPA